MKKSIKIIGALSIIVLMVVVLTGCRNNTLTATKEHSDMGLEFTETLEITFRGNVIDKIIATLDFEDEDTAISWYEIMSIMQEDEDEELTRSGTSVTMSLNPEDLNFDEDTTRDEVKEELERQGYTIK